MKTKIYCVAFGNGKISAFFNELGDNYYCSSPNIVSSLVENMVDELSPNWGGIKVWTIEVSVLELESIKLSPSWKG